jgi:hypothetical protein
VTEAIFAEGEKQHPTASHLQIMWAMYIISYGGDRMDARRHVERARQSDPQFMVRHCSF